MKSATFYKQTNNICKKPRFFVAKRYSDDPFLHCIVPGKALSSLGVTVEFCLITTSESNKNQYAYRAFFIDDFNDIVSDIRQVILVKAEQTKVTFTLSSTVSSASVCYLCIQSESDNADELQQLIPLNIKMSFTSDVDF